MEKKTYYYPEYIPTQMLILGIYLTEWVFLVSIIVIFLFTGSLIGLMVAIFLDPLIFLLLVRTKNSRRNGISVLIDYANFMLKSRTIMAKPREEMSE